MNLATSHLMTDFDKQKIDMMKNFLTPIPIPLLYTRQQKAIA
jgi:hypothetical protein